MLSVHTNNASLIAQNSVNKTNDLLSNAMERLSTGLRINSAADDAAGLQIATRLNANVVGMQTASRNVSDATSMLQTADGALEEITTIANRQKELATQAANGVNSDADLKALNDEFQELTAEMTRIIDETEYAGNNLFEALADVSFQIGSTSSETLNVKVPEINLEDLAGDGASNFGEQTLTKATADGDVLASGFDKDGKEATVKYDVNATYTDGTSFATPVYSMDISALDPTDANDAATIAAAEIKFSDDMVSKTDASGAMDMIDTLIDTVAESRSTLGANINRLGHTASNLANVTENTIAAAGRIMDTDFAVESANMTKNQLLVQAGTNILSSANQNTGLVMGLLG
ncbi:flagellin [uncultured Shewanella sp.]|uniref:flagellin N-terminal helical domain-containing protein n=1 Tax=uncultured Shewanella sp. TaxID=173975 RepID=UPI00262C024E|nr:flagellin [uncultured Shewanella sp.]